MMAAHPTGLRWPVIAGAGVIAILLVAGSWQAGRSSGALDQQRLAQQISFLQEDLATLRVAQTRPPAPMPETDEIMKLRQEVLRLQAESSQFRSKLEAELSARVKDKTLSEAFLTPGTQVHALRTTSSQAEQQQTSGYIVVVPHSGIYLFASNLPKPEAAHEYQLWANANDVPGTFSAGLLPSSDDGTAYLEVADQTIGADATSFVLTEEPLGGSPSPTGRKILIGEPCSTK